MPPSALSPSKLMEYSGSQKRSRSSSGRGVTPPPHPRTVDNRIAAQVSTNANRDRFRPFVFTNLNRPMQQMTATRVYPGRTSLLRDPTVAERTLLDLLGPADTSIMQAYSDDDLRRNLAHHTIASSLHIAMWLRKTGDVTRQRDEAMARVTELEDRVRRFEKLFVKQEAENEILSLEVEDYCRMMEEYQSKILSLSNEVNQQKQVTEVWKSKYKEVEAQHQEKATHLEKSFNQLNEANMLLGEVSQGLGLARAPEAKDPKHFWTVCIHCKVQFQYLRIYQNRRLRCPHCQGPFLAMETISSPWSSSSWPKPEADVAVKVEDLGAQ